MLLSALVNYYELLSNMEDSEIPKLGFGKVGVSFVLDLSVEGELIGVTSCRIPNGKKLVPKMMNVPEQVKKASGIAPNFLCDNSSYVLGFDDKGKPERSKECFEAFKMLHNEVLTKETCPEARALLLFLEHWDVTTARENLLLQDYMEDILKGGNFIFRLNKERSLIEHKLIQEAWRAYKERNVSGNVQQCLVTGKKAPIARLHPSIKGIYKGQSMGNSLISFNSEAYESYGKVKLQGLNAPVSEYATFAYSTALNLLLADYAHKIALGDTTIIFWAESLDRGYADEIAMLIQGDAEDTSEEKYVRDEIAVSEVKEIFNKIAQGKPCDESNELFSADTRLFILGLAPNAARISIRFFIRDSFGNFRSNLIKHYQDLAIQKQYESDRNALPIWKLVSETVSTKSKDKAASPLLAGAIFNAILTGVKYPESLYSTILLRIRAEHEVSYGKAAIMKAYLTRKCRIKKEVEEVLTLALNQDSNNKAYLLGRMFAVLEKAQQDATSGINTTIRDKYFTSACTTPSRVFPTLLSLASHHIAKSDYGYRSDKLISQILDKLEVDSDPFPKNLTLEDQGIFYLGYYHQRQSHYVKSVKEDKKDE